jgi:two-component system OmpR family response regulator
MRLMMLEARQGFRSSWVSALESSGFCLDLFQLLADGEEALQQFKYEVILVNEVLPDGDGVDWLRGRRRSDPQTPLVVMTSVHDVENRIRALYAGADDAIADSLDARELVARLRALLRRQPIMRPTIIETGNVTLDVAARELYVAGKLIAVPRRELGILEQLMLSFNRTLTRSYLEATVYGMSSEVCSNSLEVRISRIRRWLSQAGANVKIKTLRGLGYRIEQALAADNLPRKKVSRKRRMELDP